MRNVIGSVSVRSNRLLWARPQVDLPGTRRSPAAGSHCHRSRQAAEHQADHGHIHPGFTGLRQLLIVFAQAPLAIDPTEGARDDPTMRLDFKRVDWVQRLIISSTHRQSCLTQSPSFGPA